MERHILTAGIFYAPPSMVLQFNPGSSTATSCPFPGRESFGPPTVRMEGVKMVRNAMRGCRLDVADGDIALEILEM